MGRKVALQKQREKALLFKIKFISLFIVFKIHSYMFYINDFLSFFTFLIHIFCKIFFYHPNIQEG